MTRQKLLILIATSGSAGLLISAFGFQYLAGMHPCKLCLWQRWPHAAAVLIGVLALLFSKQSRALPILGAFATATTAAIAGYHTGVERGWWQGPSTCTSGDVTGLSSEDLFNQIMSAPVVRCDDIPWELFGLSMAIWNMLASLLLCSIWCAVFSKQNNCNSQSAKQPQ